MWTSVLLLFCGALAVESVRYSDFVPNLEVNYDAISKECKEYLAFVEVSGQSGPLLEMIDATSKLPSGLLRGHISDMGDYDQCVAIQHQTPQRLVFGKYCPLSTSLSYSGLSIILSTCIPDVCDVENMFFMNVTVQKLSGLGCVTKDSYGEWDVSEYVVGGILCCVVLAMLLSTAYDFYLTKTHQETTTPVLLAFSVITNTKKLIKVGGGGGQINCLSGMRCISMMWIIAGHRFQMMAFAPMSNPLQAQEWAKDQKSSYIQGAYTAVDTFFFMSAFLISYSFFKDTKKKLLTYKGIPMLYIHRLLRITPTLLALFAVQVTLEKRMSSGPTWLQSVNSERKKCLKWWWSLFLYVQNYVNPKELCFIQSWYLSADMQMFILAPFLVLPLVSLVRLNKKRMACVVCLGVLLLTMLVPMIVDLNIDNDNEYRTDHRLSVYVVGIFMGMVFNDLKGIKEKVSPLLNITLWTVMLAQMAVIVVYTQDILTFPSNPKNIIFRTFSKPAWALGLCWIVYSCAIGKGGFANWFLSLPFFQVLARFTYCMFLLHVWIITIAMTGARTQFFFNEFQLMYYWCGDFVFTFLLSVVWVLAFESPMIILEKAVFKTKSQPPKVVPEAKSDKEVA